MQWWVSLGRMSLYEARLYAHGCFRTLFPRITEVVVTYTCIETGHYASYSAKTYDPPSDIVLTT